MPIRKSKSKKHLLRVVHLQALIFFIIYLVFSKLVFLKFVTNKNFIVAFFGPLLFGILASFLFLYLFTHQDFFHFIKDLERDDSKKEELYVKKYMHYGKIVASVIIGVFGGPVFLALTLRLLLKHYKYRFVIIFISMFISTSINVALAKGLFYFLL